MKEKKILMSLKVGKRKTNKIIELNRFSKMNDSF